MSEDDPVVTPILIGTIAAGAAVQQNQQAQYAKGQAKWQQRVQQRQVRKARRLTREQERLREIERARAASRADQLRRRAAAGGYQAPLLTSELAGLPSAMSGGKTQIGA